MWTASHETENNKEKTTEKKRRRRETPNEKQAFHVSLAERSSQSRAARECRKTRCVRTAKDNNHSVVCTGFVPSTFEARILSHFVKVYLFLRMSISFSFCWAFARSLQYVYFVRIFFACWFSYFTQFHFNWCIEIALPLLPSNGKCAERDEKERGNRRVRWWRESRADHCQSALHVSFLLRLSQIHSQFQRIMVAMKNVLLVVLVKRTRHEHGAQGAKITHDNCMGGGEEHFTQMIVENRINSIHERKFNRTLSRRQTKACIFNLISLWMLPLPLLSLYRFECSLVNACEFGHMAMEYARYVHIHLYIPFKHKKREKAT